MPPRWATAVLRIERMDDGTGGDEPRGPGSPLHRFLVRIQMVTSSGARTVIGPRAVTRDQARAMMLEALDSIYQMLEDSCPDEPVLPWTSRCLSG